MNDKQSILSTEQSALVAELTERYSIEPEEIMFFGDDAKPFFTYEATCALINQLTSVQDITIEPMQNNMLDNLSLKCTLLTDAGYTRSAAGVANFKETIGGEEMSEQQIYALASSRAIRNALRTAGIDLLKLHRQSNGEDLNFKPKSNFVSLLGQAHQLGKEAFLIVGDDKSGWYRLILNRYNKHKSNELSENELADFVAVLRTLVPQLQA